MKIGEKIMVQLLSEIFGARQKLTTVGSDIPAIASEREPYGQYKKTPPIYIFKQIDESSLPTDKKKPATVDIIRVE